MGRTASETTHNCSSRVDIQTFQSLLLLNSTAACSVVTVLSRYTHTNVGNIQLLGVLLFACFTLHTSACLLLSDHHTGVCD
jgi:hypothetical protein